VVVVIVLVMVIVVVMVIVLVMVIVVVAVTAVHTDRTESCKLCCVLNCRLANEGPCTTMVSRHSTD